MNLGIICSSSDDANLDARLITGTISMMIAESKDYNIITSSSLKGPARQLKEIFMENKRKITIVGKDAERLDFSHITNKVKAVNSFDRENKIYNLSDLLLFLPGGVDSYASLYSMIESKIESNSNKPLIIYNEDRSYDDIFIKLKKFNDSGFIPQGINYKYLVTEVRTPKELFAILDEYEEKLESRKLKGKEK